MAQTERSPRWDDHRGGSLCAEKQTTAEVGEGRNPSLPVPEAVGKFEHRPVPNSNTTTWARTWKPTDDRYPNLRLTYSISCEHADGWEVSRSAVLQNRTLSMNMPNNQESIAQDVRDVRRVATAESAAQARSLAIDMMRAASALPEHTPPVVNKIAVASFRDLQQGGDGSVSREDVDELVTASGGPSRTTEDQTTGHTEEEKQLATEHVPDPMFIGRDSEGDAHFWSIVTQTVVVVSDGDTEVFEIAETPLSDLGDWMHHVEEKRGAWREHRVDTDWGETITNSVEVAGHGDGRE